MDLSKVPYVVVEVEPLLKAELGWSKDYRKVPLAVVAHGGESRVVKDSSAIIDHIEGILRSRRAGASTRAPAVSPASPAESLPVGDGSADEARWRSWVDGTLVHVLTANIYRTRAEAFQTFEYLSQRNFPSYLSVPATYIGAFAMLAVAKKVKTKHGIAGDEREALYRAANEWADAVEAKGGKFLGGAQPNLADVSVFGVCRSVVAGGLDSARDMLEKTRIGPWYARMAEAVGQPSLVHRVGEAPKG